MDFCSKEKRNKLRVLFISYNGLLEPLLYSQGITYLRELSRELNIQIVVLSFEKINFFINSKQRAKIRNLKEKLLHDNIEWYWLRYHKSPAVLSSLYDIFLGIFVSSILVLRKKGSFIHARSYVPATIALILSKVFKIKYIFDMRGFMIDDYAALGIISKEGLIKRFAKLIEKAMLKSANHIVVLTNESLKALTDLTGAGINKYKIAEVIPCCVDTKRFSLQENKDPVLLKRLGLENKFVFVYAGSLGKLYQLDKMLDFFSIAYTFIPNAYFLILTPDIQQIVNEGLRYKDLFKNIKYLRINPEEIEKYIALGDVGIAFYLSSFSRKATCPTKIGEYLACGVPFVVNAGVGDTEEWINRYKIGVILEDFKTKCYTEAINKILELVNDRISLRKRCRQAANELLALSIAKERYTEIYNSLLI